MDRRVTSRIGALAGLVGVAGNVLGVAVLGDIAAAYRPGTLATWATETIAAPGAASASAVAFTIGLVALAGWALVLGLRLDTPVTRAAGLLTATGAVLNAAAAPAPLVVALHLGPVCAAGSDCVPAAVALLGLSLALDALFNLLLGVGLVLFATAIWNRYTRWRWLAPLALAAGFASIPVSLQVEFTFAARLLAVAGPLWLVFAAWTSVLLWRERL